MKKILVINGPNLNLLGKRENSIYGDLSLDKINTLMEQKAKELDFQLIFFQSNHEGEIIDFIQKNCDKVHAGIINPGALTHYSYSLRDCLAAVQISFVEVHLSNIYQREDFRKISVIKDICLDQVYGKQEMSYIEALNILAKN